MGEEERNTAEPDRIDRLITGVGNLLRQRDQASEASRNDQVDRLLFGFGELLRERDKASKSSWSLSTIGALAALVISLITAAWTIYEKFFSQPSPELISPSIVNLFCPYEKASGKFSCREPSSLNLRAGPFVFVNHSYAANSYLVTDSWANVSFLSKGKPAREAIKLRWQFFSDATSSGIKRSSVAPIEVRTTKPESREIEFVAKRAYENDGTVSFDDRLPFPDFLNLVSQKGVDEIRIDFTFSQYPNLETLHARCTILVGQDFIDNAKLGQHVLYSRDCR